MSDITVNSELAVPGSSPDTYTLISAKWATPDFSAVIAQTKEAGAVMIYPDRAELWDKVQKMSILSYAAPAAPAPIAVADRLSQLGISIDELKKAL